MSFGPTEMLIVLAVVLLLFGGDRLSKVTRAVGEAARELRHGAEGKRRENEKDANEEAPGQPPAEGSSP